jgi:hypothetical protein
MLGWYLKIGHGQVLLIHNLQLFYYLMVYNILYAIDSFFKQLKKRKCGNFLCV